jgi:predicted secreted protein
MSPPIRSIVLAPVLALALGSPLPLTGADDGRLVHVHVGTAIELRLATTPGTGYRWQFAAKPDARVIRLRWTKLVEPSSGMVGAPATQLWRFAAVGRGTTRVRLVYVRPWRPTHGARTFSLRFAVD